MTNQLSTERYQEAINLHAQILAHGNTAAVALVEFARLLKRMRDEQLYTAFNQRFEEYVEERVGIKKRQAYTYIAALDRLGAQTMEQHASLGITKLELLSQVSPFERDEMMEKNDLSAMTTAEVKQLVDTCNRRGEQLDLFAQENQALRAELEKANVWIEEKEEGSRAEDAARIAELEKQLKQAEQATVAREASAARKARAAAVSENAKAVAEAVKKALDDERGKAQKKMAAEIEKARKAAAKQAEDRARVQYEQANQNNEALRLEIDALKKKMAVTDNQDTAIISAYCKTVLAKVLGELAEMISAAAERDKENGKRLARAVSAMLQNAQDKISAIEREDTP